MRGSTSFPWNKVIKELFRPNPFSCDSEPNNGAFCMSVDHRYNLTSWPGHLIYWSSFYSDVKTLCSSKLIQVNLARPPIPPSMNGPSVGLSWPWPPSFMGICNELENLSMREELHCADMPCHSTCKRTALCPLSPRPTWGELTLRSITSPWCFMTGWAWTGSLRGAIVSTGAADSHFLPLWLSHQIPLGNRSVKSSDESHKDVITFTAESSHCTGLSSSWFVLISLNEVTTSGLYSLRIYIPWQPVQVLPGNHLNLVS